MEATADSSAVISTQDLNAARALAAGTGPLSGPEVLLVARVATAAAGAYYDSDRQLLDDATYDALLVRLAASDASGSGAEDSVDRLLGAVAGGASAGGDVAHSAPMLSLDNAMDGDELMAWHERLVRLVGQVPLVVEPKLDGLAAACHYVDGRLVRIVTRGDGVHGEDVTDRAGSVTGLPQQLPKALDIEVRGEIYLTAPAFEAANDARLEAGKAPYVNRRNGAAGALRKVGGAQVSLSFAAYGLGPGGEEILGTSAHSASMESLSGLGIATAGALVGQVSPLAGRDEAIAAIASLESKRGALDFDIDGAVIKTDQIADQRTAGVTSRVPRWAIARKFAPDSRETVLRSITVEVGRTGALSFTAELDPVFVGGATVSRATLHNVEDLQRRIGIDGQVRLPVRVAVRRAGDVIPEVVGRLEDPAAASDLQEQSVVWEAPESCPRCQGPLDRRAVVWRCVQGRSCNLVANLTYACSRDALDVEGLSGKAIARLVEAGQVTDLADLWDLDAAALASIDRLGDTSAAKILDQLEAAKAAPLSRVVTALGIRNVGRRPSRWLAAAAGSMAALRTMSIDELSAVEGIGPTRAEACAQELAALSGVIDRLAAHGFSMLEPQSVTRSQDAPLSGKTVVVSGTVPGLSREEARAAVEALGGRSSGSVSARTDLLVCGPGAGSKRTKAESLGVAVMDAEDFAALVAAQSSARPDQADGADTAGVLSDATGSVQQ